MVGERPYFAPEGWPYIGVASAIALALLAQGHTLAAAPALAVVVGLLFMFRDPHREIPSVPLAVICPADGKVSDISTVHDPYLDRNAIRVRVRACLSGVHATRSPVEGKMENVWNKVDLGADANRRSRLCSIHGFAAWVKTDEDDNVVVVFFGSGLNRPRCYGSVGERIGQGQRCGYVPFGGCVEVFLPANVRIQVKTGQDVLGGSTILGTLVHSDG